MCVCGVGGGMGENLSSKVFPIDDDIHFDTTWCSVVNERGVGTYIYTTHGAG